MRIEFSIRRLSAPAALLGTRLGSGLGAGTLLLTSLAAPASEGVDAHALIEQNCTSCHGSEMYTREDRKIGSYSALETQVEACNTNLDTGMFPKEVEAVAQRLNEEYYKFDQ